MCLCPSPWHCRHVRVVTDVINWCHKIMSLWLLLWLVQQSLILSHCLVIFSSLCQCHYLAVCQCHSWPLFSGIYNLAVCKTSPLWVQNPAEDLISSLDRLFHKPRYTTPVTIDYVSVDVRTCAWLVRASLFSFCFAKGFALRPIHYYYYILTFFDLPIFAMLNYFN